MPRLVVREEQIHHRFMEDIEFTGNDIAQKFNKRFYIKCQDESFAKKAIGSSMIALLLSKDDIHWIEFNKDLICLFRDPMGQSIREAFINDYSAGPLAELLDFIQEILAALPPSFVNDVSVDALGNLWI